MIGASSDRQQVRQPRGARVPSAGLHRRADQPARGGSRRAEEPIASVLDVPGPIDMASFYVPPEIGEQVIDEVARKGDCRSLAEPRRRERRADRRAPGRCTSSRSSRAASSRSAKIRIDSNSELQSQAWPPARNIIAYLHREAHAKQSQAPRAGTHRQRPDDRRRRAARRPPPPSPPTRRKPHRQPRAGGSAEHHRSEGHEHPEAHADREGPDRRRRHRHAQAGADLPDPEGADRAERVHLLGRRARGAARRLRLPARARLQLPAGPRRHLRLAVADPQVRSADRRHRVRPDPAAEGRRALLRADQGRSGQLRGAGSGARQAVLRKPHAALSAGAASRSRRPTSISSPRSWICGRRSARGSAA